MHAASVSDPFHNNVSVSPVHGSWESGARKGGRRAVCVLTKEGGREGRQAGGAVAGRGMARPLHDDDDGDDELHRVPQAKITN